MKQLLFGGMVLLYLFLFIVSFHAVQGQHTGCVFKAPVFEMNFGNATIEKEIDLSSLNNYRRTFRSCPNDGYYSIVSSSGYCFNGNWIPLYQDHTANDAEGKMMLVNASYTPGTFFVIPIKGLAPNTTYELAVWVVNVCSACNNEIPISPQFSFIIETTTGRQLANFVTGELRPTGSVTWLRHSGLFTTPANAGQLVLRMVNKISGGCGNDFAMDDITIRECIIPQPAKKSEARPIPVIIPTPQVKNPAAKKATPVAKPVKKNNPVNTKLPMKDIPVLGKPAIQARPVIALPKAIQTRTNPIIKSIETPESDIVVDLYDNGEIDGDTVSIYHNNVLIVSRAALSAKPVSFRVKVDRMQPHHELVMVAENLGSIPPNTSLMIVTTRDKRYEVFISSTEQKNAKILIRLKE